MQIWPANTAYYNKDSYAVLLIGEDGFSAWIGRQMLPEFALAATIIGWDQKSPYQDHMRRIPLGDWYLRQWDPEGEYPQIVEAAVCGDAGWVPLTTKELIKAMASRNGMHAIDQADIQHVTKPLRDSLLGYTTYDDRLYHELIPLMDDVDHAFSMKEGERVAER